MVGRSTKGAENSLSRKKSCKKETTLKTRRGKAPPNNKKNELDNPSSINNYEDSNTVQKKSSFSSKTDLLDFEDKTPVSPESNDMNEVQDKGSWTTVEKKKKATTPILPRKTRSQTINS